MFLPSAQNKLGTRNPQPTALPSVLTAPQVQESHPKLQLALGLRRAAGGGVVCTTFNRAHLQGRYNWVEPVEGHGRQTPGLGASRKHSRMRRPGSAPETERLPARRPSRSRWTTPAATLRWDQARADPPELINGEEDGAIKVTTTTTTLVAPASKKLSPLTALVHGKLKLGDGAQQHARQPSKDARRADAGAHACGCDAARPRRRAADACWRPARITWPPVACPTCHGPTTSPLPPRRGLDRHEALLGDARRRRCFVCTAGVCDGRRLPRAGRSAARPASRRHARLRRCGASACTTSAPRGSCIRARGDVGPRVDAGEAATWLLAELARDDPLRRVGLRHACAGVPSCAPFLKTKPSKPRYRLGTGAGAPRCRFTPARGRASRCVIPS